MYRYDEMRNSVTSRPSYKISFVSLHRFFVAFVLFTWLPASSASGQDLVAGEIVDRVVCAADPSQSYALYVPKQSTLPAPGR